LKSVGVLQEALKQPGIADLPMLVGEREPVKFLEDRLTIVVPAEQELVAVKMTGLTTASDLQQAVKIVSAVRQAYMDTVVYGAHVENLRRIAIVERQYKDNMEQMQQKEELLAKLARNTHQPDGRDDDQTFRRESITNLQKLLTGVRERRLDVDLAAAAAQAQLDQSGDDRGESAKAKIDLGVAKAKQTVLDEAREELLKELAQARTEDTEHTQAASRFNSLQAQITQYRNNADRLLAQLENMKEADSAAVERVKMLGDVIPPEHP
jgi:chromosome segregation ATPase